MFSFVMGRLSANAELLAAISGLCL